MSKTGYIYEIYSLDKKIRYFGSTTQQVCKRIATHKATCKRWKNGKTNFTSSYLIIETDDWDYKTIEKLLFNDPFELKNRERWYIENNDCVNKQIPNRSLKEYGKEYREANKEEKKEKNKEYYEANKEKIKDNAKEKITCNCGCVIKKNSLSRHKSSEKHEKLMKILTNNE